MNNPSVMSVNVLASVYPPSSSLYVHVEFTDGIEVM